jgi:signal transduction histidine kinase
LDTIIQQFLRAIRPTLPDFQRLQIGDLLKETLAALDAEIRDRGVLVETEIEPGLPDLLLDPAQMKQVFYNLAKNALQAMTQGGLLTITLFSNDRYLGLSFKDTGKGISKDQNETMTLSGKKI